MGIPGRSHEFVLGHSPKLEAENRMHGGVLGGQRAPFTLAKWSGGTL